jgi:hypothetical protein
VHKRESERVWKEKDFEFLQSEFLGVGANISGILLALPELTKIIFNLNIREARSLAWVHVYYLA